MEALRAITSRQEQLKRSREQLLRDTVSLDVQIGDWAGQVSWGQGSRQGGAGRGWWFDQRRCPHPCIRGIPRPSPQG
jgi:hypothetical protein